jgi:pyruvate,water dikinase
MRSPLDAPRLGAGEIIVARAAGPSWTQLFARAGGLVLELGSLLGHSAVVAREYGLPGVANIPGVTAAIPDGAEITIDGRAGTVLIHG